MKTSSIIGKNAELMVADILRKNGAIVSKMNYRSRYGEIDIIAETRKHVLFVEVKLRKKDSLVSAAEAVDNYKQQKILLTAKDYLSKANLDEDLTVRFDVAEMTYEFDENGQAVYDFNYIKNAF